MATSKVPWYVELADPFRLVYEDPPAGTGGASGGGDGTGGTGGGSSGGTGSGGTGGEPPKTFTQDQVNTMLAEDRRKHKQQNDETIKRLETLQRQAGLSEQQKTDLQKRIDEISAASLSKEELAAKEQQKLKDEHRVSLTAMTADRDSWRSRHDVAMIQRTLIDEAVRAEAISPEQVVAMLSPNTRVVEVLNAQGEPTGQYVPKIKFADTDKEGKPVTLELTGQEAVKRMKDDTNRFGNLFKGTAAAGLGTGRTDAARGGQGDNLENAANESPEKYRAMRKKMGMQTVRSSNKSSG
jgi:hypothetical protein